MSGMCQGNKDPCQCHCLHHSGAEFPPPRPSSVRRRRPGTYRSVSTARVRSCGIAAGLPVAPHPARCHHPSAGHVSAAERFAPSLRVSSLGAICAVHASTLRVDTAAHSRGAFLLTALANEPGEVGSAAAGTAGYKSHRARGAMRYGCGVAWRLESCAVAARSQWRCPRGAAPASLTAPRPSPLPLLPRPAAPRPSGGRGRPAPPR